MHEAAPSALLFLSNAISERLMEKKKEGAESQTRTRQLNNKSKVAIWAAVCIERVKRRRLMASHALHSCCSSVLCSIPNSLAP